MNKDNTKELQQQYDKLLDHNRALNAKLSCAMQQESYLEETIKVLKESLEQERVRYAELLERYIKMMEEVIK